MCWVLINIKDLNDCWSLSCMDIIAALDSQWIAFCIRIYRDFHIISRCWWHVVGNIYNWPHKYKSKTVKSGIKGGQRIRLWRTRGFEHEIYVMNAGRIVGLVLWRIGWRKNEWTSWSCNKELTEIIFVSRLITLIRHWN